jgi:hypothetical protein
VRPGRYHLDGERPAQAQILSQVHTPMPPAPIRSITR